MMIQNEFGLSRARVNQLAMKLGIGLKLGNLRIFTDAEVDQIRSRQTKPGPAVKPQEQSS
jgi:hypothetical protein